MSQYFNSVPVISVTKFGVRKHGRYEQRMLWSECAAAQTDPVQLRRLTRVFARRTRRFGKPRDYRNQMRLVKALIILMCRLICLTVQVFVGFVMHTHMRIVCANLNA